MKSGEIRYMNFQEGASCLGSSTWERPIPLGAQAVIVTLTAVDPTENGHFTMYDPYPLTGDLDPPLVSSLNFTKGQNIATTVFSTLGQWQFQAISVPFSPDSALRAGIANGGTVDVVLDVVGYLEEFPATQ